MIELPARCRAACPNDAMAMAELVNMAGEGMPFYLWEKMAEEGQSAWGVGRERAQRETGGFSYRNTVVAEPSGEVVACLVGYPLEDSPEPTDYSDMPPMFVPLQQLEDMVPGTWYVNVLATYPKYRGEGYGRQLLSVAESLAVDTGRKGMSLIVADSNTGARKLYQRMGYTDVAQRPMVKEGWQHSGHNWVLMLKSF